MLIHAASHLVPVSSPPIAGGALAVHDGTIVATGPLQDLRRQFSAPVREYPGCVILPGLVNAHSHLELTHFPSWKMRKGIDYSPRTYVDWVIQIVKIKRALSAGELAGSLREGIIRSLESGTTAIGDVLSQPSLRDFYGRYPLAGRLFVEALGRDPDRCRETLASVEGWLDGFPAGSMGPGISPHAPHTLSPEFMKQTVMLAREHGVPVSIHLAESPEEALFTRTGTGRIAEILYPFVGWTVEPPDVAGCSPTRYLDSLGVLDAAAVVHCVHLDDADVELLKRRNAGVILCPRSNDRLAVGTAPVHLFKAAGLPIGLGTDSLASNDSLSMWDEMTFLQQEFPGIFTGREILAIATLGSARLLRLDDRLGSLEPGKRADFLVVTTKGEASTIEERLLQEQSVEEVHIQGEQLDFERIYAIPHQS